MFLAVLRFACFGFLALHAFLKFGLHSNAEVALVESAKGMVRVRHEDGKDMSLRSTEFLVVNAFNGLFGVSAVKRIQSAEP